MTAVAVELLTRPPEPPTWQRPTRCPHSPQCRRVRRRHRYPAHDVRVQREQRPAVLRLGTRAARQGIRHHAGSPLGHDVRSTVEQRVAWHDLPGPLRQAIEAPTGPITRVRIATAGQNSPLAAIVDTRDGKVFVKGLPSDHPRAITQAREAAVAPLVSGSPRPCCGTSTRPDGTSSATSTLTAATPTTPQAHQTLTGWCSSWRR